MNRGLIHVYAIYNHCFGKSNTSKVMVDRASVELRLNINMFNLASVIEHIHTGMLQPGPVAMDRSSPQNIISFVEYR